MISFFRRFFQSKIGLGITLGFLVLIGLAFASMDVTNTGMFGGVAGGDRVAVVGDRTISTAELSQNATSAMQQARESNPTLSMEGFIAQGGFDQVLDSMLSRAAIAEFAEMLGLRAGSRLVNSEIASSPAFQGPDGTFDVEAFRGSLRQRGLSEATVREDLALSLLARQMILPLAFQTRMPQSIAQTYAQLLNETRIGAAAAFPASAYAPGNPTAAQLQAYYEENRADFIRPERRVIRWAAFTEEDIGNLPPVTAAQIAARYQADRALYRAREQRSFTQLVVPTRAAAQAVIDEVEGGMSLEASATSKGLATTSVEEVERAAFGSTASQAVAQAGFSGDEGGLVGPVQGTLGWYVLRVDDVTAIAARSQAEVRDEIRETLVTERRAEALQELTERLEDEFVRGRSLTEAADELGVEVNSTPPLLATGQVYGEEGQAPQELARVLSFAFEIGEGEPQLAEIVSGTAFLIFDVSEITRSATAPLADIREDVVRLWQRDRGMAAAGQAAQRVLDRVEGGASLADAVAREEAALPPTSPLRISRRELQDPSQINRATILFFSMAEGTVKRVAVQDQSQWFVVELDEIETAQLAANDPLISTTAEQLAGTLGEEYVEQFVAAAQQAVTIERNQAGIDAVRTLLTGGSN